MANHDSTPEQLLKNARVILLVDWPDKSVPLSLVKAGFRVYSYSPGQYSETILDNEPQNRDEVDRLIFRGCENAPETVDIVNVFRPECEIAGIFEAHILPLKAKVLWLQPPAISVIAKDMAEANGLTYVEGIEIAKVAANTKV
jgi:predicted CoA-binding protein